MCEYMFSRSDRGTGTYPFLTKNLDENFVEKENALCKPQISRPCTTYKNAKKTRVWFVNSQAQKSYEFQN